LIQFGKVRAKEGAGPVTLSADVGYVKLVIMHAAAVHGADVKVEPVDLARIALKRLGLIGKSRERDRRPTADEIRRLLGYFDAHRLLLIPMGRIVRFAIASAMCQEEICRIHWNEVDPTSRVVMLRSQRRIGATTAVIGRQERVRRCGHPVRNALQTPSPIGCFATTCATARPCGSTGGSSA
jgi:integrase